MKTRMVRLSQFISLTAILCGCSNPLGGQSAVEAGHNPGVTDQSLPASPGTEFVSASQQMTQTTGGRFVLQGSVSNMTDQVKVKTADRGYTLYSNVQGEMISLGKGL